MSISDERRMFLEHDQTLGTSVYMTSQTHGQTEVQVFVFNCRTHLLFTNVQLISCNEINTLHPLLKIEIISMFYD